MGEEGQEPVRYIAVQPLYVGDLGKRGGGQVDVIDGPFMSALRGHDRHGDAPLRARRGFMSFTNVKQFGVQVPEVTDGQVFTAPPLFSLVGS